MHKDPQGRKNEQQQGDKQSFEFYNMARTKQENNAERGPAQGGQPVRRRRHRESRRQKKLRILKGRIIAGALLLALVTLIVVLVVSSTRKAKEMQASVPSKPSTSLASEPEQEEPVDDPYLDSPYYEAELPLLCNAWTPLPDNYSVQTASVGLRGGSQEIFMETRAASAFNDMKAAAAAEGVTLMPYSGYRSHQTQVNNYNNSIQNYLSQGYSEEQATEMTQAYYAIPGTSEHEAGLAIDINGIEESFENTPAFAWLGENAADYGFILRYPKGKQDVTGIAYEPWHYRYVGINHAKAIEEMAGVVVLEEYLEALKN